MKLFNSKSYSTLRDKKELASFLSLMIDGHHHQDIPFQKMENDENRWTLDSNNDWSLTIDEEDSRIFHIVYRYNLGDDLESAFFTWLEKKMSSVVKYDTYIKTVESIPSSDMEKIQRGENVEYTSATTPIRDMDKLEILRRPREYRVAYREFSNDFSLKISKIISE